MLTKSKLAQGLAFLALAILAEATSSIETADTSTEQTIETSTIYPNYDEILNGYEAELVEIDKKIQLLLKEFPEALKLNLTVPEDYKKISKFVIDNRHGFDPLINNFLSLFNKGIYETGGSEAEFRKFKDFLNSTHKPGLSVVMAIYSGENLNNVNKLQSVSVDVRSNVLEENE